MRTQMIMLVAALAAAPAFGGSTVIPGSAALAPLPAFPGDGLNAAVWNNFTPQNLASADAFIQTITPNATFRATQIDYPNGSQQIVAGNTSVANFIGADAGSISGNAGDVFGSLFRFSGFIAIPQATTYTFSVGSDDGMRLRIGGVDIVSFDGPRSFQFSSNAVSFRADGLYEIELVYWANAETESGLEFRGTIFSSDGDQVIPTDVLYTTPTPGTAALLVMAGALIRRRR